MDKATNFSIKLNSFGRNEAYMGKLNKKYVIVIVFLIALIGSLFTFAYFKNKSKQYDFKKHIDETAITVENKNISLKQTFYYIKDVEDNINAMALTYNKDDPNEFWNTHYSAGLDSVFIRDYAKTTAINECIYDYIMEIEAINNGVSLTKEEENTQESSAKSYYDSIDKGVIEKTGVTLDIITDSFKRRTLVQKYVQLAIKSIKENGYSGDDLLAQLSYSGEYYKQNILSKYTVFKNDNMWNSIVFGKLTSL
mgnify:FL=1